MPYRNVDTAIWNDPEFVEDYTDKDRLFWFYILTNPHNSICGVAKISLRTISYETGYGIDTVSELLKRFTETFKKIDYDTETQEMLVIKWYRYNWTKSEKLLKNVSSKLSNIKSVKFKNYLQKLINELSKKGQENNTVSIRYRYVTDPKSVTVTDSITDLDTNNTSNYELFEDDEFCDEEQVDVEVEESPIKKLYELFENEFGRPLSQQEYVMMSEFIGENSTDLISLALKQATEQGKRSLAYIRGILANWKSSNVRTIEEAIEQSRKFELAKQSRSNSYTRVAKKPGDDLPPLEGLDDFL